MASAKHSRRRRKAAAFTLVELLLVVALMLLLAGAVIINFGSMDRNARLEEGASQVETLFRYSRAQAASTGRQVRIVFGSNGPIAGGLSATTNQLISLATTNSGVQVLWEPDPVDAPGRFESLPGAQQLVEQVNDLVKVQDVGPPGTCSSDATNPWPMSLPPMIPAGSTNSLSLVDGSSNAPPPLTCYPDGSSDSMEITLAAANSEDQRLAVVTLSGMTGATRHRMIAPIASGSAPAGEKIPADLGRDQ